MRIESTGEKRKQFYASQYPELKQFVEDHYWLSLKGNKIIADTNTGIKVIPISALIRAKDWRSCLKMYLDMRNQGLYHSSSRRKIITN